MRVILVNNDKIVKFGKDVEVSGLKVIEREFVTPGLIDAHVHFFGVTQDNLPEWNIIPERFISR